MANNNKRGRPTIDASMRRDKPLIIRLSENERAIIKAKFEDAGYQAAGAFVRDYLIKAKPMQKVRIPLAHIQLSLDLQKIASLINKGTAPDLVIKKLLELNNRLLGMGEYII